MQEGPNSEHLIDSITHRHLKNNSNLINYTLKTFESLKRHDLCGPLKSNVGVPGEQVTWFRQTWLRQRRKPAQREQPSIKILAMGNGIRGDDFRDSKNKNHHPDRPDCNHPAATMAVGLV
jgi:hypothetical protein